MKLPRIGSYILLLVLTLALPRVSAFTQDDPFWNMGLIKDSVVSLLRQYEFRHNQLNSLTSPEVERQFIHLFSNPRIQVIDDFKSDNLRGKISVQEYVTNLMVFYPEGVEVELAVDGTRISQPQPERNERFLIKARVEQTKKFRLQGQTHTHQSRIVFLIYFNRSSEGNSGFAIAGIELLPEQKEILGAAISSSLTSFDNSSIRKDERLAFQGCWGYKAGLSFAWFFTSRWGISISPHFRSLAGNVTLDRFDALDGYNPNLKNIVFSNRLWQAGCPVTLAFRYPLASKWTLLMQAGLSPEVRIYETQSSRAQSVNNGSWLTNVISDAGWIDNLNRFSCGLTAGTGLAYAIAPMLEIAAGIGYDQGITSLDHNLHADYEDNKYKGQFNPLWGNDKITLSRELSAFISFSYLIKNNR